MEKAQFYRFWSIHLFQAYTEVSQQSSVIQNYKTSNSAREKVYEIYQRYNPLLKEILAESEKLKEGNLFKFPNKKIIDRHKIASLICFATMMAAPFRVDQIPMTVGDEKLDLILFYPNEYFAMQSFFLTLKLFNDAHKLSLHKKKYGEQANSLDLVAPKKMQVAYPKTRDTVPYELSFLRNLHWDFKNISCIFSGQLKSPADASPTYWSSLMMANVAFFFECGGYIQ